MKYLVLIALFFNFLFACSGDCMSCHPSLEKSITQPHHNMLTSCIKCHTKLPEAMTSCGGDCFTCHSQNKLIDSKSVPEHSQLGTCKQCHINKEDLFNYKGINNSTNLMNLLNNK